MNLFTKKFERIKNVPQFTIRKDFGFNAISFFIYALFIAAGVIVQMGSMETPQFDLLVLLALVYVIAGLFTAIIPSWITVINLSAVIWLLIAGRFGSQYYVLGLIGTAGLIISSSVQLILQWDKVVVLRLGKFRKTHGPGLIILIPLIDRIAEFIDTRIRVTDFSAEKTLTTDTVPVHVDALAFWMIWDAKSAVLEVENYVEAVILSAQTALRDAIGKHELSSLLSEREELGKEIQMALDAKTTPWGVSILSIEITDIIIPKELENAMSKRAQAEREKQSRVILAEAEVSIAKKFTEAATEYDLHPQAMQLRAMNMVYEGIRQNNSMMLMPASILDSMNLGSVLSSAALQKSVKIEKESKEESNDSNN
ncbi:MAG: slipin family protein [Sphaerochaetaceae bacterium]|nr:slipin family protein [Sphaerochaetaceae bacterium]